MEVMKMRTTDKAKMELEKLVDLFRNGEAPKALSRVVLTCKDMPSGRWTLSNRLLAFAQTLETDCRGFRQWEKANRRVKKGARAAYILRPITIKKKDENTEEEREITIGFGCIPVFPLSQTDGDPLPELAPKEPPVLQEVAECFGIHVDYQAFGGTYYGFFQKEENQIILCTHDEQVFFHELAHAAHNRILNGNLKTGQDAKQEIVAELSACTLARLYGRKAEEGNTYSYIQSYAEKLKKSPGDVIVSILSEVEKVLTMIIETSENKLHAIAA
jgi:antirestriction protein ArdC